MLTVKDAERFDAELGPADGPPVTRDAVDLDRVFEALGSPHRREIVRLVGLQPYAIHQLAELRGLSLPAIHRHIRLLETAGLITRRKIGRTNVVTLRRDAMKALHEWIALFHPHWGDAQETLDNYERFVSRSTIEREDGR